MIIRRIAKIFKSRPTIEGAGVHLKRAFGFSVAFTQRYRDDPSVLEGLVELGDSTCNAGVIGSGDVQWMTAGSGIIHQKMPKESLTGTMKTK